MKIYEHGHKIIVNHDMKKNRFYILFTIIISTSIMGNVFDRIIINTTQIILDNAFIQIETEELFGLIILQ